MRFILLAIAFLSILSISAKEKRDTLTTSQNDKIILTYNVVSDNDHLSVEFLRTRIIPSASSSLNKECDGEINKLKVVVFDRIGDFGQIKWSGLSPKAFMVPSGVNYRSTSDGYYILGESQPMEFQKHGNDDAVLKLPVYIFVYEKKQHYRIIASGGQPLYIPFSIHNGNELSQKTSGKQTVATEQIAITSSEELEAGNDDIISTLSSIALINELLDEETEYPMSTNIQSEIANLRMLRNQIRDTEIINRINSVLVQFANKERELRNAKNQSLLAAKAEEQALLQQQKSDAEAQQKAAEEQARIQDEKQQKKTFWMIACGVVLAVLGFIGNAIFKHFRDLNNQKSILQMQESLARQAGHEAERRSHEILRNKAHQIANKGKSKLREKVNGDSPNNINHQKKTKRRSI